MKVRLMFMLQYCGLEFGIHKSAVLFSHCGIFLLSQAVPTLQADQY